MIVAGVVGLITIVVLDGDAGTTSSGEIIALGVSVVAWLAIGWGLTALYVIHDEGRTWTVKVGFWMIEVGLILLAIGYLIAMLRELVGIDPNIESTSITGMMSGVLALVGFGLLLPIGMVSLGYGTWLMETLGPWKRTLPTIAAAFFLVARNIFPLAFVFIGYAMLTYVPGTVHPDE